MTKFGSINDIYLAFYAYQLDTSVCFSWRNKILDLFTGPFTHVQICHITKETEEDIILNTLISQSTNEVMHGLYTLSRPGYVFVKLALTNGQRMELIRVIQKITSHETKFAWKLVYGFEKPPKEKTDMDRDWYCSQLVAYLLRSCGVLPKDFNVNVDVTELYVATRCLPVASNCFAHPFTKQPLLHDADSVYEKFTQKKVKNITAYSRISDVMA